MVLIHKIMITSIILSMFSINSHAESIDNKLYKDITRQSHDYTCGAAALSTLINGTVENINTNEKDIMDAISSLSKDGYSATELSNAAKKLGFYVEWHKISKYELKKIKEPTLIIIGFNNNFPHYVVLKGVRNNFAFLADPILGNIYLEYDQLVKDSLNKEHPNWYVMGIKTSNVKSSLYLSEIESDRFSSHFKEEYFGIKNTGNISKKGQFIISLDTNKGEENFTSEDVEFSSFFSSQIINIHYGIEESLEVYGGIQANNEKYVIKDNSKNANIHADDIIYNIGFRKYLNSHKSDNTMMFSIGLVENYSIKNRIHEISITPRLEKKINNNIYHIDAEIAKEYSNNHSVKNLLNGSSFSITTGIDKIYKNGNIASIEVLSEKDYNSIGISLGYVAGKRFQITPYINYGKGDGIEKIYSGASFIYKSRW